MRNASAPDEEFGNFACHVEFPGVIEEREVWISEKLASREGVFFAANALTYLAKVAGGALDAAYDAGIAAERALREAVNSLEFRDGKPHKTVPTEIYLGEYLTLPDPKGPVSVRRVDGNLARSYYKTDYTQGGHGFVYVWVPKQQIWIEDGTDHRELPFIVCHEYLERRLMRDGGLQYARAHEIASALKFDLRKGLPSCSPVPEPVLGVHPDHAPDGQGQHLPPMFHSRASNGKREDPGGHPGSGARPYPKDDLRVGVISRVTGGYMANSIACASGMLRATKEESTPRPLG